MKTETYISVRRTVEAVQVTLENVNEVAEWCGGVVHIWKGRKGVEKPFIKVDVKHPLGKRQTEGRLGDWILFANDGFKVYTDKAFKKSYQPVFLDEPVSAAAPIEVLLERVRVLQARDAAADLPSQNLGGLYDDCGH